MPFENETRIVLKDTETGEKPSLLYLNPVTQNHEMRIDRVGSASSVSRNFWYNRFDLNIQTNDMMATWEIRMNGTSTLSISEDPSK